jgi:hypothetical protein
LTKANSVVCIQEWLVQRGERPITATLEHDSNQWPECVRSLRPLELHDAGHGGVAIQVIRGEYFAVWVYPSGKRPVLDVHVPSMEKPGYLGAFGPDAYISLTER